MRARAQLVRAAAAAGLCVACVPRTPASIASDAPADSATVPDEATRTCESATRVGADGSDRIAPEVIGAELVERRRIRLRLSEPVVGEGAVDPRQFRLSYAYSLSYDARDAAAYYVDPLVASPPPGSPPTLDPSSGAADPTDPTDPIDDEAHLEVIALHPYAGGESLGLELSDPLPLELCLDIADMRDELAEASERPAAAGRGAPATGAVGIYLHYTPNGAAALTDRAGNPMADIGGHWALNRGAHTLQLEGAAPVAHLERLIAIPCPTREVGEPPPTRHLPRPGAPSTP